MDIRSLSAPVIQDRSALEEFAEALTDLAPRIENDVALLRKTPAERDMIADLFRAVHNVKGDAALCKFELGVAIAHPIESMMSRFRDGELPFSDLLAELILLAIDRLELATEALLGGRPLTQLHLEELVNLGFFHGEFVAAGFQLGLFKADIFFLPRDPVAFLLDAAFAFQEFVLLGLHLRFNGFSLLVEFLFLAVPLLFDFQHLFLDEVVRFLLRVFPDFSGFFVRLAYALGDVNADCPDLSEYERRDN